MLEKETEYDASLVDAVEDQVEALAEEAKAQLSSLKVCGLVRGWCEGLAEEAAAQLSSLKAGPRRGRRVVERERGARVFPASPCAIAYALVEQRCGCSTGIKRCAGSPAEPTRLPTCCSQDPKNAVPAALVLAALGYVALNPHTVLQFIGVLGTELLIAKKASGERAGRGQKELGE